MKTSFTRLALAGLLAASLTLTSCVSPYAGPNERNGSVFGAFGGGALGAIIGNQSGRPLEGAAIGGLLGSLAGASLGANQDQYYYRGGRPVYYRNSPYRYGRTPYRNSFYRPYRTSYYSSNFGYSPAFGRGFGSNIGFGRGFGPTCW